MRRKRVEKRRNEREREETAGHETEWSEVGTEKFRNFFDTALLNGILRGKAQVAQVAQVKLSSLA